MENIKQFLETALLCNKCTACSPKKVIYSGNINSRVLILGEAPGKDEEIIGVPFVGKAGKLLQEILQSLDCQKDYYFMSNILYCFPHKISEYNNKVVRTPSVSEIQACFNNNTEKFIKITKPKIILTLGNVPSRALLKEKFNTITKDRGKIYEYEESLVIPSFHPSYLERNRNTDMFKVLVKQLKDDILLAYEVLNDRCTNE